MAFSLTPVPAANQIDINLYEDTVITGIPHTLNIYIENDYSLMAINLGFRIWSPDDGDWNWLNIGGLGDNTGCVEIVPGSRLDPHEEVFDMTGGLVVNEDHLGWIGADTILLYGIAMIDGLQPGPLEHMVSIGFTGINTGYYPGIQTLCFDSAFVPPAEDFVFVDAEGVATPPVTLWPEGGYCLPLGWSKQQPPMWDQGLQTVMIIDYTTTGSVNLSATDAEADNIYFGALELIGGMGDVVLDDHGDGTCGVSYTPIVEDAGHEISISVSLRDMYHHYSNRPPHVLDVGVNHDALGYGCGSIYAKGAGNNLITKDDICVPDEGSKNGLTYTMGSGPGTIDPVTGIYTWMPTDDDIGQHLVRVEVTDGEQISYCTFGVDVADEACCPGDANYSGTCNVGDVVYLIAYIFQGGPKPNVMNWADANADCEVNVADAVFLITYIFNDGSAPEVGCYY
jgi:hypothetical protein